MQRNTIQFDTNPPRHITLVAQGTMWPNSIEVDGETWMRTETVDGTTKPNESTRLYRLSPVKPVRSA